MTSALKKLVVVVARRSVLLSVSESGVQQLDPSAEIVSKQETNDECSFLNQSNSLDPPSAAQIFDLFDCSSCLCLIYGLFKLPLPLGVSREEG